MGDWLIEKVGRKKVLQVSGLLISLGMFTAVLWPTLVSATFSFMLVGLGVACIVPTTYSLAGKNSRVEPGIALAIVSSVSYLGFLMGPPLIGYIAEISSLRYSYALIGIFGLVITIFVSKLKSFS